MLFEKNDSARRKNRHTEPFVFISEECDPMGREDMEADPSPCHREADPYPAVPGADTKGATGLVGKISLGTVAVGEEGLAQVQEGACFVVAVGVRTVAQDLRDRGIPGENLQIQNASQLCRQEGI